MGINEQNRTNDNLGEEQRKLTLRKPSSSINSKLKKPSEFSTKPKLKKPESGHIKSPSSEVHKVQDKKDVIPGLKLIKPSHSNDKNANATQLRHSGTKDAKIILKKSPDPSFDQDLDPPSTVQRKRSLEQTNGHSTQKSSARLNLTNSLEESEESKLSVPGSLQLKKLDNNDSTSSSMDMGAGLRLRKPALTQKAPNPKLKLGDPSGEEKIANEKEQEKDVISTLTFKKPKPDGATNKLTLSSTSSVPAPDPTPPGLEAPTGLDSSSISLSQLSSPQAQQPKNDFNLKHSAISPPLKKVQFSPKRKSGLTKKQKQQVALFGLPSLLIVLGLIYLLLNIFFVSDPSSEDSPNPITRRKPNVSKPTKDTKPPADNQDQGSVQESVKQTKEDEGIAFPKRLIKELQEEYGEDAKNQFLEQWAELSEDERKDYLNEIGVPLEE